VASQLLTLTFNFDCLPPSNADAFYIASVMPLPTIGLRVNRTWIVSLNCDSRVSPGPDDSHRQSVHPSGIAKKLAADIWGGRQSYNGIEQLDYGRRVNGTCHSFSTCQSDWHVTHRVYVALTVHMAMHWWRHQSVYLSVCLYLCPYVSSWYIFRPCSAHIADCNVIPTTLVGVLVTCLSVFERQNCGAVKTWLW